MNAPRVGGDVDAYCTRCRMLLGHTVLAMVGARIARVRCNTCQGEHAYKAGAPGTPALRSTAEPRTRRASASSRPVREKVESRSFEILCAGRDPRGATPYSPQRRFAVNELVHHPTFGIGVVQTDRGDKFDVTFQAGTKTLVHGHGEAGKPPVEFDKSRRAATSTGTADKPPAE